MAKKIIVIEDNDNIRNIIQYILKQKGYEVDSAADGEDGLKKIQAKKPDIILLDVMLPGISGFDICTDLKEDPQYASIPVVLLTAIAKDSGKSDEYWRQKSGADAFLSKPFKAKDLVDKVVSLIGTN
ncbi:MAG: response regulator [Planctomycetes bacterium]|nr:response regulator [Planctomycetota bacterium]